MQRRDDDRVPRSAMGPSDEPGESNVPPAEESMGLGGIGSEGKPGPPGEGSEVLPDVRFGSDEEARAAARRLQEALNVGGTEMPDQRDESEPRTGVGTPDATAAAGGAELGGDTGDVGTPRNESGAHGGTGGTAVPMEVAPSVDEEEEPRERGPRRHAA